MVLTAHENGSWLEMDSAGPGRGHMQPRHPWPAMAPWSRDHAPLSGSSRVVTRRWWIQGCGERSWGVAPPVNSRGLLLELGPFPPPRPPTGRH